MAKSIARSIIRDAKQSVGPGGHTSKRIGVSTRKGAGNKGSFRLKGQGTTGGASGSINTGDNSGPVGY